MGILHHCWKWAREPLVHFLIIGTGLFLLDAWSGGAEEENPYRIVVSEADVERLSALWQRQWQRPPTAEELQGAVDQHVREEIYFREALALGLDREDTIVRRRMAQKMRFITEDLATSAEPLDKELKSYLSENEDRYRTAGEVSFTHVYINADRRGADGGAIAESVLARLRNGEADQQPWLLGDRFLGGHEFVRQPPGQLSRTLGPGFAVAIENIEAGRWSGPIDSAYGHHLVFVKERTDGSLPEFDELRPALLRDFESERRRTANDKLYESLRTRYEVVVDEDLLTPQVAVAGDTNPERP